MVKNDFKAISLVLTAVLLISLAVISSYIVLKVYKRSLERITISYEKFSNVKILEELSSISIIFANKTGFLIENTGRINVSNFIVYADNETIAINETYCKKICIKCSNDLNILEPGAKLYCNISLEGYKILTIVSKYARDWKVIE